MAKAIDVKVAPAYVSFHPTHICVEFGNRAPMGPDPPASVNGLPHKKRGEVVQAAAKRAEHER